MRRIPKSDFQEDILAVASSCQTCQVQTRRRSRPAPEHAPSRLLRGQSMRAIGEEKFDYGQHRHHRPRKRTPLQGPLART